MLAAADRSFWIPLRSCQRSLLRVTKFSKGDPLLRLRAGPSDLRLSSPCISSIPAPRFHRTLGGIISLVLVWIDCILFGCAVLVDAAVSKVISGTIPNPAIRPIGLIDSVTLDVETPGGSRHDISESITIALCSCALRWVLMEMQACSTVSKPYHRP